MYEHALLEQGGIQVEDGPLKKPTSIPLGTASLEGQVLLVTIDPQAIQKQVKLGNLQPEFQLASVVAFSCNDGIDVRLLSELIGSTPAISYSVLCEKTLSRIKPGVFESTCKSLGLDANLARIFLVPENRYNDYLMVSRLLTKITDWNKEPTELGSFRYDGNLTVELLEPYKAMEAKDASKTETRTGAVYLR